MQAVAARQGAFPWTSFLALFLLGLLGVVVLVALAPDAISTVDIALLAIASAVGVALAHHVGLHSLIADRAASGAPILRRLRPQVVPALAAGLAGALVITLLDYAFLAFRGEALQGGIPTYPIPVLVVGLFYGGITEEILLRWGLMSFLAWLGWRISRRRDAPGDAVMWGAIVLSAVLFGMGHLPALAAAATLTIELVLRTILLNALIGVVCGWIFWRRSLEAGMVAHAATHVGFFIFIPLLGAALVR